jgi:hypothetical protein
MIENKKQYRVTKKRITQFEESLASLLATPRPETLPSRLHLAMREGIESQLADLRQELAEYDALKAQQISTLELHSLVTCPTSSSKLASLVVIRKPISRRGCDSNISKFSATKRHAIAL